MAGLSDAELFPYATGRAAAVNRAAQKSHFLAHGRSTATAHSAKGQGMPHHAYLTHLTA